MARAKTSKPQVYTISAHVAFADALARGLIDRFSEDPLALSRVRLLLPNRRAMRAVMDGFVRLGADKGLLLPRMTPIGDIDSDEAFGHFSDALLEEEWTLLPEVAPMERRLRLAQLVRQLPDPPMGGLSVTQAVRLGDALGRTLDQLMLEGINARQLREVVQGSDLALHWQKVMKYLEVIVARWPGVLAEAGAMEGAARRTQLIDAQAKRWARTPPDYPVIAAGIVGTFPAAQRLLRVVARLPQGMVILPGLDCDMPEAAWEAIHCRLAGDTRGEADGETHPQYSFKCLLHGLAVRREEVMNWPAQGHQDGPELRAKAIARAMSPAAFTSQWARTPTPASALEGLRKVEADDPAQEALVIALALRRALEVEGKTAALVTPDRALARRVAALMRRWGVDIDDSAGTSLRLTPPATFLLLLAEAAAEDFAPAALLALLKHPLAAVGPERLLWLDQVRVLDRALRGVRPAPGLQGVSQRLQEAEVRKRLKHSHAELMIWWAKLSDLLQPLAQCLAAAQCTLQDYLALLRQAGEALAGEALWQGQAGRALAQLVADLESHGAQLEAFDPQDAAAMLAHMCESVALRPSFGRHPRLFIWGLLEARLQRADLMILGGLNEGVWPAAPAADPWLPPRVRIDLGLPGADRNMGLAAHDFVQLCGAPEVLLTRARRDASAPTVASRLWLRVHGLCAQAVEQDSQLQAIAQHMLKPASVPAAPRPAPRPPVAARPKKISVTQIDMLRADPYSWYAKSILKLEPLQNFDQEPTPAERGTAVHAVLEQWARAGEDVARIDHFVDHALHDYANRPLMAALWLPRVRRAVAWAAEQIVARRQEGWQLLDIERAYEAELGGVVLRGRADRLEVNAAREVAIIDYKTGTPPNYARIKEGFALQLGLLGLLLEQEDPSLHAKIFRYWQLSGGAKKRGVERNPLSYQRKEKMTAEEYMDLCRDHYHQTIARYIAGDEAFVAKVHNIYAQTYSDYDHLARVSEWLGSR